MSGKGYDQTFGYKGLEQCFGSLSAQRVVGTSFIERWYSYPCTTTALTTGALTANRLYAFPFLVIKPIKLDRIAINVTVLGTGNARCGIFDNDNSVGLKPKSLVLDAGEVSIATTGIKSVTINKELLSGIYWLVLVSNGTPTVVSFAIGSISPILGYSSSLGSAEVAAVGLYVSYTYAALPASFPASPTLITAVPIPAIFVRLST